MTNDAKTRTTWQEAVSAGDDCLALEVLERLADGQAHADSAAAVHLAQCPHCQTELAMLKRFEAAVPMEDEGAAVAWITAQLQRNMITPAVSQPMRRSIWQTFFSSNLGRLSTIAGLAVALILVGVYFFPKDSQPTINIPQVGNNVFRGAVQLRGPSGEVPMAPAELKWDAYPGAVSYSVELLEVDGTQVWKVQSQASTLKLDAEQQKIMHPGKPLNWKVTALDASGREISGSTSQEQFKVVR